MLCSCRANLTALAILASLCALAFASQNLFANGEDQTSDLCVLGLSSSVLTIEDAQAALLEAADLLPEALEKGILIQPSTTSQLSHSFSEEGQLIIHWPATGLTSNKSAFDEVTDLILAAPTPAATQTTNSERQTPSAAIFNIQAGPSVPKNRSSKRNYVSHPSEFANFKEAREIIIASGVKSQAEYMLWHDQGRFPSLPKDLRGYYRPQYINFMHMRGFIPSTNSRYTWNEVVRLLRSHKVKSMQEYRQRRKQGEFQDVPAELSINYRAYWSTYVSKYLFDPEVDIFVDGED
jgi:hypothetical protein